MANFIGSENYTLLSLTLALTVSLIKDRNGKIIGASKIARDITQDKKRQEALRESEVRFRTLADAVPMYDMGSQYRQTL